jgi:hypothetical protein
LTDAQDDTSGKRSATLFEFCKTGPAKLHLKIKLARPFE